ncbi:MAG: hypothetical protein E7250_15865 [Paenibacillaceae bacterium]|nr:divergent PAP2 family protein [Hungatella xylanolytica]MBE5989191.1 hypothetical protein [Paenibacillaceae bacterium]
MYDACGVRRAAGEHAKLLNKLQYLLNQFRKWAKIKAFL